MGHPMRRGGFCALAVVLLFSVGPAPAGGAPDSTGVTTRVSIMTGGAQAEARGPAAAGQPAVSDNGFVVAFVSDAANLEPDDRNGVTDVFVTQNGVIKRVSLGPDFAEANGPSFAPTLSRDGRFVAFSSAADNLDPDDTNGAVDVFVYDRQRSTVTRVSVAADGTEANGDSGSPSIDDTGAVVAFTSSATNLVAGDANGATDVFVRTLGAEPSTELVSAAVDGSGPGNGASDEGALNSNGTQIAFSSGATDLVAVDTNDRTDVFWRDLTADRTELVSLRDGGSTQASGDSFNPSISGDGLVIAFASNASDVTDESDDNDTTDVFFRDRSSALNQRTEHVSRCSSTVGDGPSFNPRITGERVSARAGVSFTSDAENLLGSCGDDSAPPDDNGVTDVYFRPSSGSPVVNERVSRDTAGAQFTRPSQEPAVSADGTLVAFTTGEQTADGGPGADSQVFGRDRGVAPGATRLLSAPTNGDALGPAVTESAAISGDGTTVAYASAAPDLVTDDSNGVTDVFVSDWSENRTTRVSRGRSGAQADRPSATDSAPAISGDGRIVAFSSSATNLVAEDGNGAGDVFVFDRARSETTRVSVGPDGAEATGGDSWAPALSADGRFVAFASDAADLVADDTNRATDVFVHDRQTNLTTRVSLGPGGVQASDGESYAPAISADGTVVAFTSKATNLVAGGATGDDRIYVRDLAAGTTTRVGGAGQDAGASSLPALSADGRYLAFASDVATLVPGDTNTAGDVFVLDRHAGTTERVSVGPGGTGGDRASTAPSLSGDGRFVAFHSDATNLVPGDGNRRTDVFVRDRHLGTTTRVSLGPEPVAPGPNADRSCGTVEADRPSTRPSISADGRFLAFQSAAGNLVAGDTNAAPDIFVHDRTPVLGYWLVAADGGIFNYGPACFFGSTGSLELSRPVVGVAATPTAQGYWLVASDGGVFAFGDAGFYGSTGAIELAKPVVGMAPTPTGQGYWLVASDGGVFAFGDAGFYGSTGAIELAKPVVGLAPTPSGRGYWLGASDGGVFAFGDAGFYGSAGALKLAQPILGLAAAQAGKGYWLVAADGGVFSFGEAPFLGSTGGLRLNQPIVGLSPSPTGAGYWMVASDGGIFSFGDAAFFGSAAAIKLARPVVGMAARP